MDWKKVEEYANGATPTPDKRVEKTPEEWQEVLSPEEFHITRQHGTERAFSGQGCEAHEPGIYNCTCCDTELFDATEQFESGSGWPSFTEPVKDNVIKYIMDKSFGMVRVEVQCNVCDGHLGHVFPDGPAPTGLRYCINSVSIKKKG